MQKTIDVGTLRLSEQHINKVIGALRSNRLSYGPLTAKFESGFANLHANEYGIFTNSGTSALEATLMAMKALYNWKDGDEVIMPATTFVATHNVITHVGLKPVLVDVGWDFNINAELIEEELTRRTRAIMPVHLLGRPSDMKSITSIAKRHGLKVIEDSCESMYMGGIGKGDVACFSFYVAHLLVTGVGGMAITNDKRLAKTIRSIIFHGRDDRYLKLEDDDKPTKEIIEARFRFLYPGYSSRGTEVEAALGLVEMDNLTRIVVERRNNAWFLGSNLYEKNMNWFNKYFENHAFMMFPYISKKRDKLMMFMEERGITTRTLMPLLNQPVFKGLYKTKKFPVSKRLLKEGMLFGCHQDLSRRQLSKIVKTIKEFEGD